MAWAGRKRGREVQRKGRREPVPIKRDGDLAQVIRHVREAGEIAVDLESNGFYAYRERICLIQIGVPDATYVVDPFSIRDLGPMDEILSDPGVGKVMHGAEFDVLLWKKERGVGIRGIFDTMHAARLLGEPGLSLGKLVEKYFGVTLDKRFQKYNWGKRPLSRQALLYAAEDVEYLPRLRAILEARLAARGKLEDARRAFAGVEAKEPRERRFDPEGYKRLRGYAKLDLPARAVLEGLYLVREQIARESNVAPFRIMNAQAMLKLAKARPSSFQGLKAAGGLPGWVLYRHGKAVLDAIREHRVRTVPPRSGRTMSRVLRPRGRRKGDA